MSKKCKNLEQTKDSGGVVYKCLILSGDDASYETYNTIRYAFLAEYPGRCFSPGGVCYWASNNNTEKCPKNDG